MVVAVLAVIALSGSLLLIVSNLPVIVGGTTTLAAMMGLVPVAFFAVGFIASYKAVDRTSA